MINGSVIPTPPLAGQYRCLVVDPPWDQGKTGKRSVRPNQGTNLDYPTMTYDEVAALPVGEWAAPNAFLWLWATNSRSRSSKRPILLQAFELMEHWGFRYYTVLTWDKRTGPCPFGPYQITTEHSNRQPYYVWPWGVNKYSRQLRIYFVLIPPVPSSIDSRISDVGKWPAKQNRCRINHSNLVMQLFECGFVLGANQDQDRIKAFMSQRFPTDQY